MIQTTHLESDTPGSAPTSEAPIDRGTETSIAPTTTPDDDGDSKAEATTTVSAQPSAAEVLPAPAVRPVGASEAKSQPTTGSTARQVGSRSSFGGRELRRARIVVTVRRTESYKRWLEENPLQAIIASEVDEDTMDTAMEVPAPPPG
jgi:hypothetical protein